MTSTTRMYLAVITVAFLITGSAVVWFFINGNFTPKPPLRAKQVKAIYHDNKNMALHVKVIEYGINSIKECTLGLKTI